MAWAAVGVAVVSGGVGMYQADQASRAQDKALKAQSAASAAELAFAKEQQAKWDATFGPIQENLSNYYQSLDPNDVAAQSVQAIQQSYQASTEQMNQQLAQRGMDTSGVGAELSMQGMFQSEAMKAQARQDAPRQVAEQQAGFLGLGLGQQGILQQGMQNAFQGQQNLAAQQYGAATNSYNQAIGGINSGIGAAAQLYGYMNQPKQNVSGYKGSAIPQTNVNMNQGYQLPAAIDTGVQYS